MRKKIGIRPLKNKLTDVIRRVNEERGESNIIVPGRPVAVLRPLSAADAVTHTDDEVQQEFAAMAELARRIGENWPSSKSARQLLEEMREETDGDY